ncbi:MAG: glycine cleavage system aminomethyltransferase GcvT [Aestuariivita sp.]|nr:glycine cleavage system aminomethyltransferase GcvT [Aestuariivita sp.]MCY4204056.1 glycine cleavage system aminomethyltransferase GcvT [Aestuariivita sp.]MCY4290082.1 glycine cleavage system aminomethyltransferase GcvT [Aestuariivita sp.]MCY4347978.1 glycine cleavage system aminomethyltransferase GcvT [Aestuariivita sp.]
MTQTITPTSLSAKQTPLFDLHCELGAKMVTFAGYALPVQYSKGVLEEHRHTRAQAGLFDVSHMGQIKIEAESWTELAHSLEKLMPQDILGLREGSQRYGFLTTDAGGILDDVIVIRRGDTLWMVANASRKDIVAKHLRSHSESNIAVTELTDWALIALQGPASEAVLREFNQQVYELGFMESVALDLGGVAAWISRSGYTGEDGFELSLAATAADTIARALIAHDSVAPVGLGARDSLRLEAGLCLYGQDITEETTPIEANLSWVIPKCRRNGGERAGGFLGAEMILNQLDMGPSRRRVGLRPEGRAPMRSGVRLYANEHEDTAIGEITSGGFGQSVGRPIAMGYVNRDYAQPNTTVYGELRGRRQPVAVVRLPFVAAKYKRSN